MAEKKSKVEEPKEKAVEKMAEEKTVVTENAAVTEPEKAPEEKKTVKKAAAAKKTAKKAPAEKKAVKKVPAEKKTVKKAAEEKKTVKKAAEEKKTVKKAAGEKKTAKKAAEKTAAAPEVKAETPEVKVEAPEVKAEAPEFSMMFLYAHPSKLDMVKETLSPVLGEEKLLISPKQNCDKVIRLYLHALDR